MIMKMKGFQIKKMYFFINDYKKQLITSTFNQYFKSHYIKLKISMQ